MAKINIIIPIKAGKPFDNTHLYKNFLKQAIKENFLNLITDIYEKNYS
jgi:hypothetical protein